MGALRVGAAVVDLGAPPGAPLAGHGLSGRVAKVGRALLARAVVFEGSDGQRAAVCVIDALSGTRIVWDRVASRTAAIGLGRDRVVIAGTHTHHGPGGIFGATLYDALASSRPGARPAIVVAIADRIAGALERAALDLRPARLGMGEARLWGVARNGALAAFARNPEAARWHDPGAPGHGAPPSLDAARRAIDPRVRVIVATDDRGGAIATLATFAAHATAMPAHHDAFDPDWPGIASSIVEARAGGVVAISAGPTGDTNVLDDATAQGPALAARVGERVAEAILEAIAIAGGDAASDVKVDPRFADRALRDAPDLAPWCFGAPAMGGAEDGRSPFYRFSGPTRTSAIFPLNHPQHPKAPALGRAGVAIGRALGLEASTSWPLHAIRLGRTMLVTVPGEPTITAARRIERAIAVRSGARDVIVLGCAGEYAGYFTTAEEYAEQAYEGASTLHGRQSAARLTAWLTSLI